MSLKSTFKVVTEHEELYPDFIRFSGGEINVKLTSDLKPCIFYRIVANIVDAEGIMQLLLLKDAIDREGWNKAGATSTLVLPYLPYSRQDRVCNKGESLSVKVMADLVNNMKFDFVETWDCHSDVGVALIDHCTNITKTRLFSRYMDQRILSKCFLISPDAGALKSVYSIAKQIEVIDVIEASKKRDVTTGNITNTVVHADGDFKGQTALIVDDICDGGYTFIKLAEKLKEKGFEQVYLYVTHGIFSKGFEVFDNLIDRIYTTNSFEHKWEEKPDFVKVINR